jgi:hypothetical protein
MLCAASVMFASPLESRAQEAAAEDEAIYAAIAETLSQMPEEIGIRGAARSQEDFYVFATCFDPMLIGVRFDAPLVGPMSIAADRLVFANDLRYFGIPDDLWTDVRRRLAAVVLLPRARCRRLRHAPAPSPPARAAMMRGILDRRLRPLMERIGPGTSRLRQRPELGDGGRIKAAGQPSTARRGCGRYRPHCGMVRRPRIGKSRTSGTNCASWR